MKTLTNRAIIAAAILAVAAFIVGYGRRQQDSGGKYAEVNGLSPDKLLATLEPFLNAP